MKLFHFLPILLLVTGCVCESGLYTAGGKCCTFTCRQECEHGYVEGTCNCECITLDTPQGNDDSNQGGDQNFGIDDLFDDNDGIEPPVIPN